MASFRPALTEAPQRNQPHWNRPVNSGPRPCLVDVGFPLSGPQVRTSTSDLKRHAWHTADLAYGESGFGGVGTRLYTMLLYVLLAVFLGGLMVGRTPEYLGKKIAARDIKLVTLGTVFTPFAVLVSTTLALATSYGRASILASGPQGFSESLYAYMSQANNNGSAFAVMLGGVVILVGALTCFPALLLGPVVQDLTTRLF